MTAAGPVKKSLVEGEQLAPVDDEQPAGPAAEQLRRGGGDVVVHPAFDRADLAVAPTVRIEAKISRPLKTHLT